MTPATLAGLLGTAGLKSARKSGERDFNCDKGVWPSNPSHRAGGVQLTDRAHWDHVQGLELDLQHRKKMDHLSTSGLAL